MTALSPRQLRRRCCRSRRTCAWAGASTPTGPRSRREHGWPVGVVDATPIRHTRAGRRRLRARRTRRRGARVPRRPAVRRARRGRATLAVHRPMKVAVVAEYYPRAADPVLGVWAHRQALAARDAGADVRVLVLHRPVPPRSTRPARRARRRCDPASASPARRARRHRASTTSRSSRRRAGARYGTWGAWAAPSLAVALRRCAAVPVRPRPRPLRRARRRRGAAGARSACRSWSRSTAATSSAPAAAPGAARGPCGARCGSARLVLANSAGDRAPSPRARRARHARRAPRHRPPAAARTAPAPADLVTVGHLVARKRHADVLRALWLLRDRTRACATWSSATAPSARALERLAARARASRTASSFAGQLPHDGGARAPPHAGTCSCCRASTRRSASPTSRRWPAGCRRSARAASRARRRSPRAGDGMRLVPPGDVEALAAELRRAARRPAGARSSARAARATVERAFTWERCGARDGRRLRGRAAMNAASCSSPTTSPPDRVGAFAALHERDALEFALFGGRSHHATGGVGTPACPHRHVEPARGRTRSPPAGATAPSSRDRGPRRAARRLAAARAAPGSRSCSGARSGRTRARPRTALRVPLLRHLYRDADAVVTYGPHVAPYVGAAARAHVVDAPQAVDDAFWSRRRRRAARTAAFPALFVGRAAPEKGRRRCCCEAWAAAALGLAGGVALADARTGGAVGCGARRRGAQLLRGSDVVVVPSLRHARLPRAVGARRQRSHAPGSSRHRHRRRRRRRRRARPPRAQRARRPRRRRRRAAPPRCGRCTTTPRCARGWAPTRRTDVAAYTHDAWADGFAARCARDRRGDPLLACRDAPGRGCVRAPARMRPRHAPLLTPSRSLPRRARDGRRRGRRDQAPARRTAATSRSTAPTRRRSYATRSASSRPTSTSTPTAARSRRGRRAALGAGSTRAGRRRSAAPARAPGAAGSAALGRRVLGRVGLLARPDRRRPAGRPPRRADEGPRSTGPGRPARATPRRARAARKRSAARPAVGIGAATMPHPADRASSACSPPPALGAGRPGGCPACPHSPPRLIARAPRGA